MGAISNFIFVEYKDKKEVEKTFYQKKAEDEYEYGHNPYSGSFATFEGIKFTGKSFEYEKEAKDYILDESEKGGDALAVEVKDSHVHYYIIGGWCAT